MSTKFRLFASVAAPLLSLPILLQPAYSAPIGPMVVPAQVEPQASDVIRVQAPAPQGDDEQDPRKKRPQKEGQERQAEQGKPQRRDNQAGAGGDQQAPKPRRQQNDDGATPDRPARTDLRDNQNRIERPQRNQQGSDQDTGTPAQRPQRSQQGSDQDTSTPSQRPQRNQPKADQAEQPAPARPKPAGGSDAGAQPDKGAARPQSDQENRPARPPKGADAQQNQTGQQPARPPRQDQGSQGQAGQAPADQVKPGQAQPGQAQPGQPRPPARPAPGNDAAAPAGRPAPAGSDQQQTRPAQARPGQDPQSQAGQPPARPAPGQPGGDRANGNGRPVDPQAGNAGGQPQDAPLRGGQRPTGPQDNQAAGDRPQPDGDRPGRPPQTARTPEQVERAREIARDPKAAKPGEQAVLPVENGAAVLDSAKRPTRRGADDRNQPGQAGQAGQPGRPARNPGLDQPPGPPPRSDADAQGPGITRQQEQQAVRDADRERGQKLDRRPQFERPRGWEILGAAAVGAAVGYAVGQGQGNQPPAPGYRGPDDGRVIMRIDDQDVVRHDDSRRFYSGDRQPEYDRLDDGRVREVIVRDDGTRIITIRNRYGEVIQRSRVVRGGQEYVLYYAPQLMNETRGPDYVWRDPGDDLPPMRLQVPLDDYIADASSEPNRDYYQFLEQPPVERVERVYSLDEVRYSARLRDKVRRIDLDTITFATGSSDISMNQAGTLRNVADGIKKVLDRDPSETFLIEGHTDAVGSDQANLVLSDQRAESVARVLTDAYGIPPENMATQGYGEQYLKVQTDGASQENRRVTIRRITPLVRPVAQR